MALKTRKPRFTFVDAPGAGVGNFNGTYGAWAHGLTDTGVVSGAFYDNNAGSHGYIRSPRGTIRTFDVPGAGDATGQGAGTYPSLINLLGTIIGYSYDPNSVSGRGFVRTATGPPGHSPSRARRTPAHKRSLGASTFPVGSPAPTTT